MAKGVKRTIGVYINGKEVENNIAAITRAMAKLSAEQKNMTIGCDEYMKKAEQIKKLRSVIDEHNQSLKTTARGWDDLRSKLSDFGNIFTGLNSFFTVFDGMVSGLKQLAKDAAAMDDVYATVRKTTNMTREEVMELNESFKKMDTRTSREELNHLAEVAGRLGVAAKGGQKAVMEFVEASDIINIALGDILGENAIRDIGKMADVFSKVQKDLQGMNLKEQMLAVANAVNELGKTSTANEQYLVNFAGRLGGVATQAGISVQNILGFGSALDQNMQRVEMSATAIQKFIMKVMGDPAKFANIAGLEVKKFSQLLDRDANGAIKTVIRSLGEKGGFQQLIPIFKDMGLDGARAVGVLSALATNMDKVDEAQRIANQAVKDGTSALDEYNIKNNNMQAELEKARKKFTDMRLELGEKLYPTLIRFTKTGTAGLKLFSASSKVFAENKVFILGLASAYAVYLGWQYKKLAVDAKGAIAEKAKLFVQSLALKSKREAINLEAQETLAKAANRLETEKQTLANLKAINIKKAGISQGLKDLWVTAQSAVVKKAETAATVAQTRAENALRVAKMKSPWGLIAAAVITAGYAVYKYVSRLSEAEKATKDFNAETAKHKAEAEYLFESLEKTTRGSDEYKRILEKLKTLYPDIIQAHIDEKGELINIKKAYEDVVEAIESKIAAQQKEDKINAAKEQKISDQADTTQSINKLFDKQNIPLEKQKDIWKRINEEIEKAKKAGQELNWKGEERGIGVYIEKYAIASKLNVEFGVTGRKIRGLIGDLLEAEKTLQKSTINFGRVYDPHIKKEPTTEPTETDTKTTTKKTTTKTQEEIDEDNKKAREKYLKDLENFNKEVENLREKARVSKLKDFEKEIYETEKQYDKLIAEATRLKKGTVGKELEAEKEQALFDITAKYAEKYQEQIDKIADKQSELLQKGEQNSLLSAIAGSQQKWQSIIDEIDKTISSLEELKKSMKSDDPEMANINTMIGGLNNQRSAASSQMQTDASAIIEKELKRISDILRTEQQKQIDDIRDRYNKEIQIAEAAIKKMREQDAEANAQKIEEAEDLIVRLREKQNEELEAILEEKGSWLMQMLGLTPADLKDLDKTLGVVVKKLQNLADKAFDIANKFNQRKSNLEQTEFNKFSQLKDAELKVLDESYDKGLISRDEYERRKEEINDEVAAKELEMRKIQFQREKRAATIQATISGILAAVLSFQNGGGYPWGLIPMALSIATTAAEIAMIQSQPEPYAKGGYIKKEKIIRAGEAGNEWIASNALLSDPQTAPIIQALENYQRGNSNAFNAMGFSTPSSSFSGLLRHTLPRNDAENEVIAGQARNDLWSGEIAKDIKKLTQYLSDPKNRQAIISRKIMTESENQEATLRNLANL